MKKPKTVKPKIGIIGVGMVGGPLKRYLEELQGYQRGRTLFCYDLDPKKNYFDDINRADIIFICVPTPNSPDGKFNISAIESSLKMIKPGGKIIVIKSTVLPSVTEHFQKRFPKHKIVFNPESLTEARAWRDFIKPDRQIVGHTQKSRDISLAVLSLLPAAPFMTPSKDSNGGRRGISCTEAEMAKMAVNVFGTMKVSFGNILADLAAALKNYLKQKGIKGEINYENIKNIIAVDRRIGASWLDVGYGNYCGFGGYCFPKDVKSFINFFDDLIDALKKKRGNKNLIVCLKKGQKVFQAIWDYNAALLKSQNLTVADVSQHDKDIALDKKRSAREEK